MGYLNPLLRLPAGRALLELPTADRLRIARVMRELREQAHSEAETSWRRRKGFAAAYWRAVSTYARHVAHALTRKPEDHEKAESDFDRLLLELESARLDVGRLLEAARGLVPEDARPDGDDPALWALAMRRQAWRTTVGGRRASEVEPALLNGRGPG